jgi:4-oxalocrotonate tautomerase
MSMPLVQVKAIEGVLTAEQKREIVHKVTDAVASVVGEALRPGIWVLVEEVSSGAWGVGGKPVTTDDVRSLAAGKATG